MTPAEVLDFWFGEVTLERRFQRDAGLDREIRDRFGAVHAQAVAGECDDWAASAEGALALIVLLDQFSRNLFREDGRAFEADARARHLAEAAIAAGHDRAAAADRRTSFYLPFMHSEDLADQERCVELYAAMPESENGSYHAREHHDLIRRFGRFPHRNRMLGRTSTPEEERFLAEGGYAP